MLIFGILSKLCVNDSKMTSNILLYIFLNFVNK